MNKRLLKNSFMQKLLQILIVFVLFAFVNGDNRSIYLVPVGAWSICAEDIDTDGDIDIVIGNLVHPNLQNSGISILKNNGFGLMECDSFDYYGAHRDVKLAFLDNNQQYDLITQTDDGQVSYVGIIFDFIENQNNTQAIPVPEYAETFATGDVDNDTAIDILFISDDGQFWGMLYNDGMGNFSAPEYHYVDDYYPIDLACGDLNDDGWDDVVVCGQKTEVYLSYPSGFDLLLLETDEFNSNVIITDFDIDGDNDIIAFDCFWGYTTVIMYNNLNDNTFERIDNFSFQQITSSYCVADFNNDYLPDVLFHNSIASAYVIYFNKGNFQLDNPKNVPLGSTYEALKQTLSADIDGNGHTDIVTLCNYPFSRLIALFNDGDGNFVENPIVAVVENELSHSGLTCCPNPFRIETNIQFTLKETAFVELSVYDLQGKQIAKLISRTIQGGAHFINWDGTDSNGYQCKKGIYFVYLTLERKSNFINKIILY
jgi:hypothetical protein